MEVRMLSIQSRDANTYLLICSFIFKILTELSLTFSSFSQSSTTLMSLSDIIAGHSLVHSHHSWSQFCAFYHRVCTPYNKVWFKVNGKVAARFG
jgi:hypothetical protein